MPFLLPPPPSLDSSPRYRSRTRPTDSSEHRTALSPRTRRKCPPSYLPPRNDTAAAAADTFVRAKSVNSCIGESCTRSTSLFRLFDWTRFNSSSHHASFAVTRINLSLSLPFLFFFFSLCIRLGERVSFSRLGGHVIFERRERRREPRGGRVAENGYVIRRN